MASRGQVSTFIILGIVLLIIITLSIAFKQQQFRFDAGTTERIGTEVPQKAQPIKIFIEQCIMRTTDPGIRLLSLQGGTINFSRISEEQYAQIEYGNITYGLEETRVTLPTREQMAQELAGYLPGAIRACVGDLASFRPQWREILAEDLSVAVHIADDRVLTQIHYPLTFVDAEGTYRIADFSAAVPLRLGYLHSTLQNITKKFAQHPEWVDATLLSDMSTDLDVGVIPIDSQQYVLTVTDHSTTQDYVFLSAVRIPANEVPKLTISNQYTIPVGQPFRLQITAADDKGVQFSDDTTLFNINPASGEIQFTPHTLGMRVVRITATDAEGKYDDRNVQFVIQESP